MTYRYAEIVELRGVTAELLELMAACWRECHPTVPFRPRLDILDAYHRQGMMRIWGAYDRDELVGYLAGYVATCLYSGRTVATEDALYVRPAHRRRMVGQALVEFVVAQIAAEGVERIETVTRPDRQLHGFLRAAGFRPIAALYERCLRH